MSRFVIPEFASAKYPGPRGGEQCPWPWVPALGLSPSAGMTAMAILQSRIDPNSEAFRANRRDMLALIEQFRALEARVRDTSNQKLPSSRSAASSPRASASRSCSTAARRSSSCPRSPASTCTTTTAPRTSWAAAPSPASASSSGVRCMVSASDSAIKGGTIAPMGLKKSLRAQEIALEIKLPLISLVECGGANLIYQAEIFVDGGRTFANMARLSAAGIPQITVVHGSSTAGGAYCRACPTTWCWCTGAPRSSSPARRW